ncbi:MAG: tRNA pseudouridine(13) synthase TruD [Planctomycetes bacterium]|nr:tRNA pseudouridine(13) synthase TruD [Planctomycetota bacterium]
MRILRTPNDYRVVEQFGTGLLKKAGDYRVYNITKRGFTTGEVSQQMAAAAGVDPKAIHFTGQKAREGVAGQVASVLGGDEIRLNDPELAIRAIGRLDRPLETGDVTSNAFEIVVRDMSGDDMRRLRHNMAQVREFGIPAYYDDQRFGCLRHGQGFIVRDLLKGHTETAIRSMIAAPSPYGPEHVEKYKYGLRKRWGNWNDLAEYSRGRRGQSLFAYLAEHPGDFEGAMRMGFATSERTIHLFAYQSHLWNRALSLWIRKIAEGEDLAWLPCDEGSLPVFRRLSPEVKMELARAVLPLPGAGAELDENATRLYQAVFEAEGISYEKFLALDVPGFRPISELRPVLYNPEYLRAAPAEEDELYPRGRKMRVRFTIGRGHYSTLVLKRLLMPTNLEAGRLCLWVSRHPLVWPADDGTPQEFERKTREEYEERRAKRENQRDRDRGPRREYGGGQGDRGLRPDGRRSYGDRDRQPSHAGNRGVGGHGDQPRRQYWSKPQRGQSDGAGNREQAPRQDRDRGGDRPSPWAASKKFGGKSSKYGRGQSRPDDRAPREDAGGEPPKETPREMTKETPKESPYKRSFFKDADDRDDS